MNHLFDFIFLGVVFLLYACCLVALLRLNKVAKFRENILDLINIKANFIIQHTDTPQDWRWLYDYYDSVSFSTMMLKFYKPVDKFYDLNRFRVDLNENDQAESSQKRST